MNRARVSQLINNINPYIDTKFNENTDIEQSERVIHILIYLLSILTVILYF